MFYAVHKGKKPGIYKLWPDCQQQTHGFKGAVFKKFETEQAAKNFVQNGPSKRKSNNINCSHKNGDGTNKPTKKRSKKKCFYAVKKGRKIGIFNNWDECNLQISGFPGAKFKKFYDVKEAYYYVQNKVVPSIGSSCRTKGTSCRTKGTPGITDQDQRDLVSDQRDPNTIKVWTDGSCYGNGKIISFGGYGVYYGENDLRNKSVPILMDRSTNNIAELMAILNVLENHQVDLDKGKKLEIVTDSEYSLKAFTTRGQKYERNMWQGKIANKELIRKGYEFIKKYRDKISIQHVFSHTGLKDENSVGNEAVDDFAKQGMIKSIQLAPLVKLQKVEIPIGKYQKKTLEEIGRIDHSYLLWLLKNPFGKDDVFPKILRQFIINDK